MVLDIALKDLATGQSVFARDVLSKPTLVLAVRRPGCPLCREQAAKLSVFRRDIRKCGIDMIAVFKEELGTEEFKPTFWRDAMYLDTNRDFYKLLHGGKINKASMFSLLSTNMFAVGKRASADGYTGNVTVYLVDF
ncbi:hypothetical protein EDD86DRAFT_245207 [Gorgonomyces haynaldii]|nr:hypothetical protein EDD86DRAFT_245207 [Gorgonomyces haynaldii]